MQQADKFKTLGIKPPKGALMYGPPGRHAVPSPHSSYSEGIGLLEIALSCLGTGKTLLARVCAAQTNACYLKLAGPSLVQVRLIFRRLVTPRRIG